MYLTNQMQWAGDFYKAVNQSIGRSFVLVGVSVFSLVVVPHDNKKQQRGLLFVLCTSQPSKVFVCDKKPRDTKQREYYFPLETE
jgi:hypothetical protein